MFIHGSGLLKHCNYYCKGTQCFDLYRCLGSYEVKDIELL